METNQEGPQMYALSDNEASDSDTEAEAPVKRAKREATPTPPAGSDGEQSMRSARDEVPPQEAAPVMLAAPVVDLGVSGPEGGDSGQWKQVVPRGRKPSSSPPLQRPCRSRSRGTLMR